MSYKFIVDAQLPSALARYLSNDKNEDAIHVLDMDMLEASDKEIWDLALSKSLVIISKDEDFQQMAAMNTKSPNIIWVRVGNISKKALLEAFDKQWEQIISALDDGESLIELQ